MCFPLWPFSRLGKIQILWWAQFHDGIQQVIQYLAVQDHMVCVQIATKTARTQQLALKIEVFALQTALLFRARLDFIG